MSDSDSFEPSEHRGQWRGVYICDEALLTEHPRDHFNQRREFIGWKCRVGVCDEGLCVGSDKFTKCGFGDHYSDNSPVSRSARLLAKADHSLSQPSEDRGNAVAPVAVGVIARLVIIGAAVGSSIHL